MPTITLTHKQLSALKQFLERTEMRGFEVRSFLDVANAVNEASKDTEPPAGLESEHKRVDAN